MQAKYRTYVELAVFLGLCAAIALVAADEGARLLLKAGFWLTLALLVGGAAIFGLWRLSYARQMDVSLLTGALWELIRAMETRSRTAASGRATDRERLLYNFAVDGAQKVAAGRPMQMGGTSALDLTTLAFELMDRNDRDGGGHGNRVNSLRRGLFIFYALLKLRKPELAFRAMCEHMKMQLRLGEESGVDNFTELKRLLALPAEWPTDLQDVLRLERRGLPLTRELAIFDAMDRGLAEIFRGVHYIPPGDSGPGFDQPEAILERMREYIR